MKDEHGLQSYFVQRIESFLNSKGRRIIGWDEILEGGLAPNATVMSWRGEEGGIAAAREKHDVIMASSRNHLYFNDRPTARTDVEALRAAESLRELYAYDPVPAVLTPEEAARVKGVTGAIWTEYVRTPARLEYTLLPRMLALSEIAWTPVARKDYARFTTQQLPRQLARLDAAGYEYRVPVAIGPVDTMMQGRTFKVVLQSPVEGARIYWTIDGYPASETDELYTTPFTFDIPEGQQRELQTVVVTPTNRKSRVARTVMYNRPQPENNPFGVVHALEYRLFKGPIADLATMDRSSQLAGDTASSFDLTRMRARGASFGVVYFGQIVLDRDGTYTFELASTGPARLYIDDRLVAVWRHDDGAEVRLVLGKGLFGVGVALVGRQPEELCARRERVPAHIDGGDHLDRAVDDVALQELAAPALSKSADADVNDLLGHFWPSTMTAGPCVCCQR